MKKWVDSFIQEHLEVIKGLDKEKILELISILKHVREIDGQIFLAGNGGNAACSSHLYVDLAKGASYNKTKRFRVTSLVEDVSLITAIANDLGYENIFSEQLLNFAKKGDLLLIFSVSGSSPNIVKLVETANKIGLYTVCIVGDRSGKVIDIVNLPIIICSEHFGHVETIQTFICHILSYYFIENEKNV